MIDTIKLCLQLNSSPEVSERVQYVNTSTSKKNNECTEFMFKGHKFILIHNPRKEEMAFTLLFEGSFTKLLHENNLVTPTLHDFRKLVNELSENFGVDFNLAMVQRLDLGVNIIVIENVMKFIKRCIRYKNHERIIYEKKGATLYFKSAIHSIILYDKIAEMIKKRTSFPVFFRSKNILRIENRLMRRLQNKSGKPLILNDVLKKPTFEFYFNKLLDVYFNIEKIYSIRLLPFKDIRSLKISLSNFVLSNYSDEIFIDDEIQKNYEKGLYSMSMRSNLRKEVRNLMKNNKDKNDTNIFSSVDDKMNLIKKIYR